MYQNIVPRTMAQSACPISACVRGSFKTRGEVSDRMYRHLFTTAVHAVMHQFGLTDTEARQLVRAKIGTMITARHPSQRRFGQESR